mmetsp:Transcript_17432/g.33052  ORF Transcript_17432/g.33052 Transcript_17432/m.33052 type:complete len:141 (+) Transcript_17432:403-825(+)
MMNDKSLVFLPQIRNDCSSNSATVSKFKNEKKSDVILEGGPLLPMTRHRKNHKINHPVDPLGHGFLHDGRRRTRNATTIPPRTANIMFDSRVCRGNTYANKQAMAVGQQIKHDMFKSNTKKSKRSSFQQISEKVRHPDNE